MFFHTSELCHHEDIESIDSQVAYMLGYTDQTYSLFHLLLPHIHLGQLISLLYISDSLSSYCFSLLGGPDHNVSSFN